MTVTSIVSMIFSGKFDNTNSYLMYCTPLALFSGQNSPGWHFVLGLVSMSSPWVKTKKEKTSRNTLFIVEVFFNFITLLPAQRNKVKLMSKFSYLCFFNQKLIRTLKDLHFQTLNKMNQKLILKCSFGKRFFSFLRHCSKPACTQKCT